MIEAEADNTDSCRVAGVSQEQLVQVSRHAISASNDGRAVLKADGYRQPEMRCGRARMSVLAPDSHRVTFNGDISGAQIAIGNNNSQTVIYPDAAWFAAAKDSVRATFDDPETVADLARRIDELQHAASSNTGFVDKAKSILSVLANLCQIGGVAVPPIFHGLQQYVR